MTYGQCSSCGGFCKKSGCERENVKLEPEPKCVMIVEVFGKDWRIDYMSLPVGKHKLYTHQYNYTSQPQREWQGLTENDFGIWREPAIGILRWAEAVLKERNK